MWKWMCMDSLFAARCCDVETRTLLGDVRCSKLMCEHCCDAHSRMHTRACTHANMCKQTHTHTGKTLFIQWVCCKDNLDEAKKLRKQQFGIEIIAATIKSHHNKQHNDVIVIFFSMRLIKWSIALWLPGKLNSYQVTAETLMQLENVQIAFLQFECNTKQHFNWCGALWDYHLRQYLSSEKLKISTPHYGLLEKRDALVHQHRAARARVPSAPSVWVRSSACSEPSARKDGGCHGRLRKSEVSGKVRNSVRSLGIL